jgi:diamine N-acetyltransferase
MLVYMVSSSCGSFRATQKLPDSRFVSRVSHAELLSTPYSYASIRYITFTVKRGIPDDSVPPHVVIDDICAILVHAPVSEPGAIVRRSPMPDTPVVGPEAHISLREVTLATLPAVCKLSNTLTEPQKRMVASNAYSIAEAHLAAHAWFRAIYADEVPVGFIMLHDSAEGKPGYFIWRLMVGGPYQRMGFGRRAVELLIDYVRTRPGARELLTSCGLGEGSPEGFYLRVGFKHTGKMWDDEAVLSMPL